ADCPAPSAAPLLMQAAFCIDVRSEVYRRALEAQHPGIQTLGFAGFFGLPLSYEPADSPLKRPQLPGLLAPTLRVCESGNTQEDLPGRAARLNRQSRWQEAWSSPTAAFSLVESA
ncbi:putative inorganic carbon transporter subunit DabA, partial [Arthrospira platensis SPKY1]|nr:putative inorganic carbon transporter subunit DabA [Arthrospira platensis SPKY1]